jgi:hypothetical protein
MSDQNDPVFGSWQKWTAIEKAAAEPFEKDVLEYRKAAAEFSKLLVTNLHLINAGALLAVPTLSAFLGFTAAPRPDKLWLIGVPVACFTTGLLFAALCALATHRNFMWHADFAEWSRHKKLREIETAHPGTRTPERGESRSKALNEINAHLSNSERRISRTYYAGHITGWISALCFISGCIFLAINIRV